MHDIKWIRENPAAFDNGLKSRGLAPLSADLLTLDEHRRAAIAKAQAAQERRNAASKEIGAAMKARTRPPGRSLEAGGRRSEGGAAGVRGGRARGDQGARERSRGFPIFRLPEVPFGKDENDNPELRAVGEQANFRLRAERAFRHRRSARPDGFRTAARNSPVRVSSCLKGALARLERALGQFMLDLHTGEHGYTEVNPPLLVRDAAMFGTAQLPKFDEDQFLEHRNGSDFRERSTSFEDERDGNSRRRS